MLYLFEKHPEINNKVQNVLEKNIVEGNCIENIESLQFKEFIQSGKENFDKDTKLLYAISCILLFVQENFTGPNIEQNCLQTINDHDDRWKIDSLFSDGIELNANIKQHKLLLISRNFINDLKNLYPDDLHIRIWFIRILKAHQLSLDENSISLYDDFRKLHEDMALTEKLNEIDNLRHKFIIELEIISIYLMYRRIYKAEELLKQLKNNYHIEMIEEGILGKRTKWQEKALPQFHVSVKQDYPEMYVSSEQTHGDTKLLKLLDLEDDTRLETIKFLDEKHNEPQLLSSVLQNFILIVIKYMQISQPKDKLSDEEIQSYLTILLKQNFGPWSIRLNALLINIKFESNHRRTVDRSLRQCEDIVKYMKSKKESKSIERQSYIFSSLMTPLYKIEVLLADLMVSLGLIKGALDIYLNTHQWENVIKCYTLLQLKHKAAEIIQQELEKKPTVKLYCLLGDANDDVTCYEKAWEFSKYRSGLAQKHWGMHFFGKVDYKEAIPHLQKSLEINSLQENLWLRLGYAALSIENYELASSAYIRYTQLEPNGFESWNNLAKCFIKMGNKNRAHKVLQESLKCNYDNWKIWENFLLVSIDIGAFEDAINAYTRLIELKEKYFDEEVLKILIKAISENILDHQGSSANRLRKKALELLAHLGSIHATEGIIWELSANLTEESLKKAEKLQKAYKGYTSKSPNWSKNESEGLKLIELSHEICSYSLEATKDIKENEKMLVLSQLSSARLTAQGCIKVALNNNWDSCKECIEETTTLLENIVFKIKELK
ncbi:hypothetical protein PVAND_001771 [Polypedilum vanderplanki]|uniref:Tetratricopeptide repeat protein n=1 Tax=Polypedilum vanderplanki TaxID=319348 RepID=A0A9J6BP73_POLVA|nr:hypothetical protein PVAND_001771 [Polypedilum vanderplanki]